MYPSLFVLNVLVFSILRLSLAITALPNEVNLAIPECASGCVQAYVADELSFCHNTTDINCLCRASSSNGYTLGEAALACMRVECSGQEFSSFSKAVFSICDQVLGAASPTHATITAPSAIPATVTYSNLLSTFVPITTEDDNATDLQTSSSTMSSTKASSSMPSFTTTSSISATSSVSFDTSISPITPSSLAPGPTNTAAFAQSAAATTSAAAGLTPVLGTGQIAGIAVAGTVTAATAFGLIIFIFCGKKLRRKNGRRDSDASFGGSHIYISDPESTGGRNSMSEIPQVATPLLPAPPRSAQGGPKQNQFLGLPVAPNQHRQSWLHRKLRGVDNEHGSTPTQIGVAKHLTPKAGGISQDTSPSSVASYRTTSQLLPEKPMYKPSGLNAHEKKASNDTAMSQPIPLGGGVALRVTAPTPEPFQQAPPFSYNVYEYPRQNGSQPILKKEPSMEGSALKGKLSDPFLNKAHEQGGPTHPSAAMFNAKRASRSSLPKISTAPGGGAAASNPSHSTQSRGVPNFRSLVQPRQPAQAKAPQTQRTPPPQLPNVAPFSPLTPDIPASGFQSRQDDQSIMNRGRPQANPFFSSQQSQLASLRPYRNKSKRIRPETHYTTGSDTSFEDDEPSPLYEPSPLSPPGITSHMAIAELPGLSPVAESPASRTNNAMRTPSPKIRGSPPSEEKEKKTTPLSKIRYPQIPGSAESPRREVGTIPLAMAIPRDIRPVHVAQLQKPSSPPGYEQGPRHQRQRSLGSTVISPTTQIIELESPVPARSASSPNILVSSPHNQTQNQPKPKLVPSPLRPAHGFHHAQRSVDYNYNYGDIPPPPPPKDDPAQYYPSPSTTTHTNNTFSTRKFHDAARRLGSMDASTIATTAKGLGNWPVQPTTQQRPVELPAGLGNWPVQPTRGARRAVNPDYEIPEPLTSPELTFASSTMRVVPPENVGRVILPGASGRMMHAPPLKGVGMPARKAVGSQNQAYTQAYDVRENAQRMREIDRRRELERQQKEAMRNVNGSGTFDPSLSTAPLLPNQSGVYGSGHAYGPRSVLKTWGVDQGQARRELLGGRGLQDPRAM